MRRYYDPIELIGRRKQEELIKRAAEERLAREFERKSGELKESSEDGILKRAMKFIWKDGKKNRRLSTKLARK